MRFIIVLVMLGVVAAGCSDSAADPSTTTSSVAVSTSTTTSPSSSTTTTVATTTTTTTTILPVGPLPPPPLQTWTVILASLDKDTMTEADAIARWQELVGDRPDGGVLLSDDYPSLNPGYWVVYVGQFNTELAATGLCADFRGEGLDCYHRWLGGSATTADEVLVFGGVELPGWRYISLDTGTSRRTYGDDFEASWAGHPSITADGAHLYFTMGFEDYWFNCEATIGELRRLDLATGEVRDVGSGLYPAAHPSSEILAYATDDDCFEDQYGFNSFNDLIVVRDLRNGINRQYSPGDVVPGFTIDLAWSADGETLFVARDTDSGLEIYAFEPLLTSLDEPWTAAGPLSLDLGTADWLRLAGEQGGDLYVVLCATGECDLVAIDLETGTSTVVATAIDGAAFDAGNEHLLYWGFNGPLYVEGQPVELEPGFFIYEADW